MHKIVQVALFSVMLLAVASGRAAETADEPAFISVQGAGQIFAAPDQAKLTLSFVETSTVVATAKNNVDVKIDKLSKMLLAAGIKAVDINNAPLRIQPEYQQDKTAPELFRVERELSVLIRDLLQYPQILEKAAALGVSQIQAAEMLVANSDALYQQALQLAYEDASQKAQLLAKLAGRKIVGVRQVQELGAAPVARHKSVMMAEMAAVHYGNQGIRAELSVQFALNPAG